jgi:hypothetical protein
MPVSQAEIDRLRPWRELIKPPQCTGKPGNCWVTDPYRLIPTGTANSMQCQACKGRPAFNAHLFVKWEANNG